MGDAVGQVLSPAIGVAVSPVPLIAVAVLFPVLGVKSPGDAISGLTS